MAIRKTTSRSGRKTSAKKSTHVSRSKFGEVMREYKQGELKSGRGGKGGKVKSRQQAVAIGLSEARKAGARIPKKKAMKKAARKAASSRTTSRKSTAKKTAKRASGKR